MFTGIVEELGTVEQAGRRLVLAGPKVATDSEPGSSVCVNGVCLTVVERDGGSLAFDLSDETLARTALGELEPGDPVNLERSVTLATRLGGHLVQGHVDGVGSIAALEADPGGGATLRCTLPDGLFAYVVEKGSIAVNGVSLTAVGVRGASFGVALVPFTMEATTFGTARAGDRVNLEVDVIAKYVESLAGRTVPGGEPHRTEGNGT